MWRICILARAEETAAELGNARALKVDVTDASSIASMIEQVPQLDILVNNAGIGHVGDLAHTEAEDFARVMDVNVKSVYLVTRAALPLILRVTGRSSTWARSPD